MGRVSGQVGEECGESEVMEAILGGGKGISNQL